MAINRKRMRFLYEGIGMFILFLAAFFELIIEKPLIKIKQHSQYYRIENKLDAIWGIVATDYCNAPYNKPNASIKTNLKTAISNWEYAGEGGEELVKLVDFFTGGKVVLFLTGSFLLLTSKKYGSEMLGR